MKLSTFLIIFSITFCLFGCKFGDQSPSQNPPAAPSTESPEEKEQPAPPEETMVALSWKTKSGTDEWTKSLFKVIDSEWASLMSARDATRICPKFQSMDEKSQKLVFAELIVAMAKFESAWNPLTRYKESTMGIDPVTKQQVYSEGLLQLSYQDTQWAPYCEFDWSKDKALGATDPKKTIFDPNKNLTCGVKILARQVKSKGFVIVSSGAYWAVIKENGRYQKINEIISMVQKAVPSCK